MTHRSRRRRPSGRSGSGTIAGRSFAEIQADPALMHDRPRDGPTRCSATIAPPAMAPTARAGRAFPTSPTGLAVGRRAGSGRRDHPRRDQLDRIRRRGSRRCWRSAATGCSTATQSSNVVAYVLSLSDPAAATAQKPSAIAAGKEVFAANCAACHGEDGKGKHELGAPDLTDATGSMAATGSRSTRRSMTAGRGTCRTGSSGLTPVERKILALYVARSRGGGAMTVLAPRRQRSERGRSRCWPLAADGGAGRSSPTRIWSMSRSTRSRTASRT